MPFLKEENVYWRTPEFLQFTGKTEYRVLKFLMANIVRDVSHHNAPAGAFRIYQDFYKNGLLAASYSQDNIAKYFGFFKSDGQPNGAYISKLIKRLAKMELLKIHKIQTPLGKKNIYEFGHYQGTIGKDDYQETLYFDSYFGAKAEIHRLEKIRQAKLTTIRRNNPDFFDELQTEINLRKNELVDLHECVMESYK